MRAPVGSTIVSFTPAAPATGWNVEKDRVRYCDQCKLSFYNFSAMSSSEIKVLLNSTARVCGRLYQRPDGTILTKDCPVGFRVRSPARLEGGRRGPRCNDERSIRNGSEPGRNHPRPSSPSRRCRARRRVAAAACAERTADLGLGQRLTALEHGEADRSVRPTPQIRLLLAVGWILSGDRFRAGPSVRN
jgi:hypothetical protein